MRRLLAIIGLVVLSVLIHGCMNEPKLTVSDVLLLSEFNGPGNYTELGTTVLGDDQGVTFYVEIRDFGIEKSGSLYEFWVSVDIRIGDETDVYIDKTDQQEIHIKNATEKPGMVYYKYPWNTGNMVRSGDYWVKIVAKDKLLGRVAESRLEFEIDLDKQA